MMTRLRKPIVFETTFETYTANEQIGEGGSGRVYGAIDGDGNSVAVKILTSTSKDKRSRFKNEINFLQSFKHKNIVPVLDHGIGPEEKGRTPFYVMPRFEGSLRDLLKKGLAAKDVMPIFSQILDGVEAAHLKGVIHRDLKPENILFGKLEIAIADFGIARFTEDLLVTLVKTAPTDRLANFQYAAPEQRIPQSHVTASTDLYALGLILNEMFTGVVAHGTEYRKISDVSASHLYLDQIVERMLRNSPADRPRSVRELKAMIGSYEAEAVTLQRLSAIDQTVIPVGAIDDPLAHEPPKVLAANWDGQALVLTLDRPVNEGWVNAFKNMGHFTSVLGAEPRMFMFSGPTARLPIRFYNSGSMQQVVDYFKTWLPQATRVFREDLMREAKQQEQKRREQLRAQREHQERLLAVNRSLRV